MNWEIKRLAVWPVIKISFLIFFILFFILSLFYCTVLMNVIKTFGTMLSGMEIPAIPAGIPLFFISLFLSVMGAIFYSLIFALAVLIYNAISNYVGGFRIELEPLDKPDPLIVNEQHVSLATKQMTPGEYFSNLDETEEEKDNTKNNSEE